MEYVRCRYCDLSWFISDVYINKIISDENIAHEKCQFTCHACGLLSDSYIFKDNP